MRNAKSMGWRPVAPIVRIALVVSGLKPVLRRGWGAVLGANSTRPVLHGVRVRVVGNWLGPQISKADDKYVNANWEFFRPVSKQYRKLIKAQCHKADALGLYYFVYWFLDTTCLFLCRKWILSEDA
jgi:hypothetical protein